MRKIDEPTARAAARDAADRQMRDAGRSQWNDDDWNMAVRTYNGLIYGRKFCAADESVNHGR